MKTTSPINLYKTEQKILLDMYDAYQDTPLSKQMSFTQYFDSVMRLDSTRQNEMMHNFIKAEQVMHENFMPEDLDSDDII